MSELLGGLRAFEVHERVVFQRERARRERVGTVRDRLRRPRVRRAA